MRQLNVEEEEFELEITQLVSLIAYKPECVYVYTCVHARRTVRGCACRYVFVLMDIYAYCVCFCFGFFFNLSVLGARPRSRRQGASGQVCHRRPGGGAATASACGCGCGRTACSASGVFWLLDNWFEDYNSCVLLSIWCIHLCMLVCMNPCM